MEAQQMFEYGYHYEYPEVVGETQVSETSFESYPAGDPTQFVYNVYEKNSDYDEEIEIAARYLLELNPLRGCYEGKGGLGVGGLGVGGFGAGGLGAGGLGAGGLGAGGLGAGGLGAGGLGADAGATLSVPVPWGYGSTFFNGIPPPIPRSSTQEPLLNNNSFVTFDLKKASDMKAADKVNNWLGTIPIIQIGDNLWVNHCYPGTTLFTETTFDMLDNHDLLEFQARLITRLAVENYITEDYMINNCSYQMYLEQEPPSDVY